MPSKKLIELRNLFLATSMLTVGAAGAVQAQETSSETVTVTGTRIVRDGYNAPTPLAPRKTSSRSNPCVSIFM